MLRDSRESERSMQAVESASAAGPAGATPALDPPDEAALPLAFVRDRDVECPRCGYNLRAIQKPVCPECGTDLQLSVGERRIVLKWLLLTMVPGAFSGVASILLGGLVLVAPSPAPFGIYVLLAFGVLSGAVAIALGYWNRWFRELSIERQGVIMFSTWFIHILAFALFVLMIR